MKLQLFRKWFTNKSTIGELFIDGNFQCYILEDTAREGVKVHGETCIPAGLYKIKITYSNRFKRLLPLIYNNDDYSVKDSNGNVWNGIKIHPGNMDKDTLGCQLTGYVRGVNSIGNSKRAFEDLYKVLYDKIGEKDYIEYEIINQNNKYGNSTSNLGFYTS